MVKNINHPVKGSTIKVEPLKNERDIRNIKRLLRDHPRNLAIFTVGINTNLRASDLVLITVGNLKGVRPGEHFTIREQKTGKLKSITLNKTVYDVVQPLLGDRPNTEPLFVSEKTKVALNPITINLLVKSWCRDINLRGNFGSHTLRKTFGYIHRTIFNTDIPTLMTMYNHSTQRQTLDYLCIQADEIQDAYLREI